MDAIVKAQKYAEEQQRLQQVCPHSTWKTFLLFITRDSQLTSNVTSLSLLSIMYLIYLLSSKLLLRRNKPYYKQTLRLNKRDCVEST